MMLFSNTIIVLLQITRKTEPELGFLASFHHLFEEKKKFKKIVGLLVNQRRAEALRVYTTIYVR